MYLEFLHHSLYGHTVLGLRTVSYLRKTFLSWTDPLGKGTANVVSSFNALQFLLQVFDGALKMGEGEVRNVAGNICFK